MESETVKTIDLTMPFDSKVPMYPGSPAPKIRQWSKISEDGFNENKLEFGSHTGTHIDAPYHMLEDGKKLDDFSIGSYIGKAIVIDAQKKNEKNEIIADISGAKGYDFVFFYTGNSKNCYSQKYFENNPVISTKLAQQIADLEIKIVGLDSYTPDNEPFETHKLLFRYQIRIVENLVNLHGLIGKTFECIALPLHITGSDGAPCRVIARLKD